MPQGVGVQVPPSVPELQRKGRDMSKDDLGKDYVNIINPKDFSSIEFKFIQLDNTSSGTKVESLDTVEFIEFEDNVIILDMPQKCGAKGHNFIFKAEIKVPSDPKKIKFEATFKLKDFENLDDARMKATCELIQYEEKDWMRVIELYAKRQEELTQFILNTRGIADIS